MTSPSMMSLMMARLRPTAKYYVEDELLYWQDEEQKPPSPEEFDQARLEIQAEFDQAVIAQQRQSAFTAEADPLFFKMQRGEATMLEWQTKVEEIRQRYPYPD